MLLLLGPVLSDASLPLPREPSVMIALALFAGAWFGALFERMFPRKKEDA